MAPFAGWELADSIVVNPHKWLFTPLDASLLLTRRMDQLRAAFSLQPEYLRTLGSEAPGRDYNEYQPQLGRRFRALKLWILMRTFGLEGLRARINQHLALAAEFSSWIDADQTGSAWPRPRSRRSASATAPLARPMPGEAPTMRRPRRPERRLMAPSTDREVFLSHTRLAGRFTIRLAIGNLRTEERHVARAWALLRREAARLGAA